ncbi:MAG: sugar-binding domain-containing protein, partial [Mucilaginibacter sp.]
MKRFIFLFAALFFGLFTDAQDSLITNTQARKALNLNGKWQYIVDPYETGFYDYRYKELNENNGDAYWNTDVPANKSAKKEHGYTDKYTLDVPGDWNHQKPEFLYYEGTVWYKKTFDYNKNSVGNRFFIYFGAVNYRADVYLNGKKLGMHKGGFTPFNFEIPSALLKEKGNYLVVKVDNKRYADEVPTLNTDWWNYGGITRDVKLLELPVNFIQDYVIQLKKPVPGSVPSATPDVEGWIQLSRSPSPGETLTVEIPELKLKKRLTATGVVIPVQFKLPKVQLWSPENPKLYRVIIKSASDQTEEKIGFRTIEAFGKQV